MSRIQFVRQMLPRICKDFYELEIYHNPTGAVTFDPTLTTSVSTTVIWQTEAGTTVTTGTTHNLSYTPTAGMKRCVVRVNGGLGLVTGIDARADALISASNLNRTKLTSATLSANPAYKTPLSSVPSTVTYFVAFSNTVMPGDLRDLPRDATTINCGDNVAFSGSIADLPTSYTYIVLNGMSSITGSLVDLRASAQTVFLYLSTGITPGSIAHLTAVRDLRIYSMGWTAQQNTDVLLSAWGARANYTYASGIALRIGAPTGTPGTEPPAAGESNADWSWNAGTSRHDPLTGYAVKADLENDFYEEGFKAWAVTIV